MGVNRNILILGMLACVWPVAALAADLDGDPAALISGSANYQGGQDWTAVVSYAVYAPGDYLGVFSDSDSKFIYAYQVFNDSTSGAVLGSFSVGLLEDAGVVACGDDATYGVAGGESPLLSRFLGTPETSAQWITDLDAGESSTVLIFSSFYGYTWDTGVLIDGGQGFVMDMPTPSAESGVPEPATLSLLALGGLALIRRRRN